jgi:hypothetical protein
MRASARYNLRIACGRFANTARIAFKPYRRNSTSRCPCAGLASAACRRGLARYMRDAPPVGSRRPGGRRRNGRRPRLPRRTRITHGHLPGECWPPVYPAGAPAPPATRCTSPAARRTPAPRTATAGSRTTRRITITMPIVARLAEPGPPKITSGTAPITVAIEVIRIGRRRTAAASTMASCTLRPASRNWLANSTIRMPFFAASPTSMTMPICENRLSVPPVSPQARAARRARPAARSA